MQDPSAFAIDNGDPSLLQPGALHYGTHRFHGLSVLTLRQQLQPVVFEHGIHRGLAPALFQIQESGVIGQCFHQPVIVVFRGGDNVAPPLMRRFMRVQYVRKEQLLLPTQGGDSPLTRFHVRKRR